MLPVWSSFLAWTNFSVTGVESPAYLNAGAFVCRCGKGHRAGRASTLYLSVYVYVYTYVYVVGAGGRGDPCRKHVGKLTTLFFKLDRSIMSLGLVCFWTNTLLGHNRSSLPSSPSLSPSCFLRPAAVIYPLSFSVGRVDIVFSVLSDRYTRYNIFGAQNSSPFFSRSLGAALASHTLRVLAALSGPKVS